MHRKIPLRAEQGGGNEIVVRGFDQNAFDGGILKEIVHGQARESLEGVHPSGEFGGAACRVVDHSGNVIDILQKTQRFHFPRSVFMRHPDLYDSDAAFPHCSSQFLSSSCFGFPENNKGKRRSLQELKIPFYEKMQANEDLFS